MAREDGDSLASAEIGAVSGQVKEAVCLGNRGKVTGALPADGCDGGDAVGPIDTRGEKVSEASFFVERFAETSFQEGQRFGVGSGQKLEGERREQFKRDHCRDGISGEAEDWFVLAGAEYDGFAGSNGDGVKMNFGIKSTENVFHEIVLPCRNSAGEDEDIVLEALPDFFSKVGFGVFGADENDGFAAMKGDLRGE